MPQDSNSLILQLYARAPAPCRDYFGLTITKTEVILNIWNITYGPHVYPKRQRRSLNEFLHDKYFQEEVRRLLGEHVLEYITSVAKNERKLQNLPEKIFLCILKYLAMKDIINLSQTSKIMFELCDTGNIWKILFGENCKRRLTRHDQIMAESFGWKNILKQKIQITNNKNLPAVRGKFSITLKSEQNKIKSEVNLRNTASVTNSSGNKSSHNQKGTPKMFKVTGKNQSAKTKIDTTKSSSALANSKHAASSNLKVGQTKSAADVNSCVKNPPQKTKNYSNFNTVKSSKNTEIKTDILKALEESAACNNVFANSKSKICQKHFSVKN